MRTSILGVAGLHLRPERRPRATRISIEQTAGSLALSTVSGLRLGDPASKVPAIYGDRVSRQALIAEDRYVYYPIDPRDATLRMFVILQNDAVVALHVGELDDNLSTPAC